MKVIIYKQDNGVLAIITPNQEAVDIYGIDAIASKDVPFGKRYAIIDHSQLPQDREFRDAWTVDDAELNDGVGGKEESF